jgi:methionine-rich copper-binding protein CopC
MTRYLIITLSFLLISGEVFAHSHFEASSPKVNETLTKSPEKVEITFEEALRPDESYIKVLNSKKVEVSKDKTTLSEDKKTITETLPKLKSGTYTVEWKAVCLCADHHATDGKYKFTVK